jgi:hypothetical protein
MKSRSKSAARIVAQNSAFAKLWKSDQKGAIEISLLGKA